MEQDKEITMADRGKPRSVVFKIMLIPLAVLFGYLAGNYFFHAVKGYLDLSLKAEAIHAEHLPPPTQREIDEKNPAQRASPENKPQHSVEERVEDQDAKSSPQPLEATPGTASLDTKSKDDDSTSAILLKAVNAASMVLSIVFTIYIMKRSIPKPFSVINLTDRIQARARIVSNSIDTRIGDSLFEKKPLKSGKNVFLFDYVGDSRASANAQLKEAVDALCVNTKYLGSEFILKLHSPGGTVTGYSLASEQLLRLKRAGYTLTVCVDEVAASGGYMMACTADKVVASPMSVIGSIGVVMEFPNIHKLLLRHGVEYHQLTAGERKRDISVMGQMTEEGVSATKEALAIAHSHFKRFILEGRPNVDIDKVATGQVWSALDAKGLGLVDEISTSDEYILAKVKDGDRVLKISVSASKGGVYGHGVSIVVDAIFDRFEKTLSKFNRIV